MSESLFFSKPPVTPKKKETRLPIATVASIKKFLKDDTIQKGKIQRLRAEFPTVSISNLKNILYGNIWKDVKCE